MGVCCIVFDIDGMLFEFFMNFFKYFFFFSIFHVFFVFHAISNIKKKNGVKKNSGGGGGGGLKFFFRKTILSYFTFYAIFNIKKIETPRLSIRPSRLVYWLNGAEGPGREILQRPPPPVRLSVRHV